MASDINSVTIIGRLTRDAEMKYTNSGAAVAKFSIAVNDRRKKGEEWVDEASFIDITLWGKSAEAVTQYLTKGKQIAVQGKLKQDRWEQDGQPRSRVGVTALSVQLLGDGRGATHTNSAGQQVLAPGGHDLEDDNPY